tara:strand:- start:1712 stop:2365 length:654 start_codon:yes stop_codon:yes gene_type:complete
MDNVKIHDKKIYRKNSINKPALFLDRDGVIIKERHYLKDPSLVEIEEGSINVIKHAKQAGFLCILVSNQSGIGRKYFTWSDYEKVTSRMLYLLGDDDLIDAIYANSCSPLEKKDNWRKPNIGMIQESIADLKVNLNKSILVGDRLTDLQAGVRSGIKHVVHVLSGHGLKEREQVMKHIYKPNFSHQDNSIYFSNEGKRSKITMLSTINDFPLEMFQT